MCGHWFIYLEQQEHAFLGSALRIIQITRLPTSLPTSAICASGFSLQDAA